MATTNTRMTRSEALEALRLVQTQLVTHEGICQRCYEATRAKQMRTTSWPTWTPCETLRALRTTRLTLEHRVRVLKQAAVKKAAAAHGLSPWQFQRQKPEEYAQLAAQFGE